MAFQTGSQVRPELGRADVSGFARGGMAIGAGVLQGIENYQEQKQITSFALSDLEGRMTADPSILAAMEQAGQNNPKIGKALKSLKEGDYKQNDVLTLSGFASSLQSQKAAMQLATLTQAKLDSLSQPKRPTIGDITKLREFLPSDKVIEDGRIVDTTLRNEILPENHPLVQQLLQTDVGQSQLYGYQDSEFLETKEDDGTPVEPAEIIETPSINVQEEPTGSRASQLLRSVGELNEARRDAMSSARSLPLALGNFLFSEENPTFSESMNYAKPKMETLRDIGFTRSPYEVFNPFTRIKESVGERFFSK